MTWSRGRAIVAANRVREEGPLRRFVEQLYPNVEHNHVLHEQVVILTARSAKVPRVHPQDRITVDVLGYTDDISHVTPRFGFQEDPDIPDAFRPAGAKGVECDIDFEGATYSLSWATVRVTDATGMDRSRKRLSVAIWRDSANPVEYLRLPDRRAITMGWRVPL